MSINQSVLAALAPLDVPVSFQTYSGKETSYITFFTYLDRTLLHADDAEVVGGFYVQIDLWSKVDYTELARNIHSLMTQAGFYKVNFHDLYEKNSTTYHKVMRYVKEELKCHK